MRAKLAIVLLLFWALTYLVSASEISLLQTAKTASEIAEWGKKHAFAVRVFDYEETGKKLLVLLADAGSGVYRDRIYLYLFERSEWSLVLVRYTNTKVTIDKTETSLVFRSKSGAILLEQPFESIQLSFTKGEQ